MSEFVDNNITFRKSILLLSRCFEVRWLILNLVWL